jgi:hypothetical protein
MPDLATKLQTIFDDIGQTGIRMLVASGPAVEGSTDYSQLVAYADEPEPEILELVPLQVGLDGLMIWFEGGVLDEFDDDGPLLTLELKTYTAAQLAAVDTEGC